MENDSRTATVRGNFQLKWLPSGRLFQSPLTWHFVTEDLEGGHILWPWCMIWKLVCGEICDWPPRLEVLPDICRPNGQLIIAHWILLLQSSSIIRRQNHLHLWSYLSVPQASPRICMSGLWWLYTLELYDFVKKNLTFPQRCLSSWEFWRLDILLCSATKMRLLMGWGTTKSCRSIRPRSGNHSLLNVIVRGDAIALPCYRQNTPFSRWLIYYSMQPHGGGWTHTSSLIEIWKILQPSIDKSSTSTKKNGGK